MDNRKDISSQRKNLYQIGVVLSVIGVIMFLSTFVMFAINFGDFDNFEQQARNEALLSISGFILIIIGSIFQSIGRNGLAGSGWFLDTEQERKDLEPINRMKGGQLNDVLEEANLKEHLGNSHQTVIKIRCQSCRHLNDENDKFCGGCGKRI